MDAQKETSLAWNKPQIVRDWEKQSARKLVFQIWVTTLKWGWLFGAITLLLAYHWGPLAFDSPATFETWFKCLVLLCILLPLFWPILVVMQLWINLLSETDQYQLSAAGIACGRQSKTNWQHIEQYFFTDHPQIVGIRLLRVKPHWLWFDMQWQELSFDPVEIPESQIRAMFDRYLPCA